MSRTRMLDVGGIRSPLIEAGLAQAREAVVFVHGNPGSHQDWTHLVEQVGGFARAVAWDHPGYGQADKPADFDYTVAGYAAHIDRALAVLGIDRVHLAAHDFGGPWGVAWAGAHPERLVSATLFNTGVLAGYRWHSLASIWRTPIMGEAFMAATTRAGFRTLLRRGNPRGLPRAFVDRMYDDFDRDTRRAVLRLYRATDDPAGEAERLTAALRPLDRPALVVWGRADPYIPVEQAERQRRVFPRAEVHVLDRSGHWPFIDDPETVERLVCDFLRRTMAAEGSRGSAPR